MITFIKGTERSHNGVLKVAALVAAMSSEIYQRKTLILQVADNLTDVEYLLTGHVKAEEAKEYANEINTEETGIDSLLIRAETERVVKEQFDSLIDPASKDTNGLDVAPRTVTENIEDTVLMKRTAMRDLMNFASGSALTDTPYDNCIVILNGKNPSLAYYLEKYCDNMIICVGQRKKDPETEVKDEDEELDADLKKKEAAARKDHNTYIVISDYEADSIFNKRFIQKEYGEKKVFLMPHNVIFNDACATGNVVNFVIKNRETDISDYNHGLMQEMDKLMLAIYKEQLDAEDELANVKRRQPKAKPTAERSELPDGSVTTESTTTKRFLRKPVTKTSIVIDTDNPAQPSDIMYQEMPQQEGYYDDEEDDRPVRVKREKPAKKSKSKEPVAVQSDEDDDDFQRPYTRSELRAMKKQQIKEAQEEKERAKAAAAEARGAARKEKEEAARAAKQAAIDAKKNAKMEKERARLEAKLAKTGTVMVTADEPQEEAEQETPHAANRNNAAKPVSQVKVRSLHRPVKQEEIETEAETEYEAENEAESEKENVSQEEPIQDAAAEMEGSEESDEETFETKEDATESTDEPEDAPEEAPEVHEEKTETKTSSFESDIANQFKSEAGAQKTEEEVSAEDLLRSMM